VRNAERQLSEFSIEQFSYILSAQIQFRLPTQEVLLRILFIEYAILLMPEARAPDAVVTALEVDAERQAVGTVAVLTVEAGMELAGIDALVTVFAVADHQRIDAILRIIGGAVVAILRVDGAENEVAVLHVSDVVAEVGVLRVPDGEGLFRDYSF
jgi:hypothetical protein